MQRNSHEFRYRDKAGSHTMIRKLLFTLPPWSFVALAMALVPFAVYVGGHWNWTAGTASLAMLAVPTCLAAINGNRAAAVATALVGVCGCILEAGFSWGHANTPPDWGFVMLSIGVLLGLSGTLLGIVDPRKGTDGLDPQTAAYLRELYSGGQPPRDN